MSTFRILGGVRLFGVGWIREAHWQLERIVRKDIVVRCFDDDRWNEVGGIPKRYMVYPKKVSLERKRGERR
jgi:hypothetical protein